jgi:hypothetical protein
MPVGVRNAEIKVVEVVVRSDRRRLALQHFREVEQRSTTLPPIISQLQAKAVMLDRARIANRLECERRCR